MEYTPEFEALWTVYPRKTKKLDAFEAWQALNPGSDLQRRIIVSVQEHLHRDPQWTKNGGAYIPYPATYLNARRWEDQLPAKPEPQFGDSD